jgi:uncharacterized protein
VGENDFQVPFGDISVDKEGIWFYRGAEIVQRPIVELFFAHLFRDNLGRYLIHWRGETCYLQVDDTPFVVWAVTELRDGDETQGVLLRLSDGTTELLEPSSLYVGAHDVPYCLVHRGAFTARFSRKAYYQLTRLVEEDPEEGAFFIRIRDQRFYLRTES